MRFRRAKPDPEARLPKPAAVLAEAAGKPALPDETAYRLIEEARLRCLSLRDRAGEDIERLRWMSVHRELGMAGYLASTEIPSCKRRSLLAQAHEALTGAPSDAGEEEYTILKLITSAAAETVEALLVPALAEPVQLATEHLARARHLLVRALSEQRARSASAA